MATAAQQVAELVRLLVKTHLPGHHEPSATVGRVASNLLAVPRTSGAAADEQARAEAAFDRLDLLVQVAVSDSDDAGGKLDSFRSLRRRFMAAGTSSSTLAGYRFKGALMDLLSDLSGLSAQSAELFPQLSIAPSAGSAPQATQTNIEVPPRSAAAAMVSSREEIQRVSVSNSSQSLSPTAIAPATRLAFVGEPAAVPAAATVHKLSVVGGRLELARAVVDAADQPDAQADRNLPPNSIQGSSRVRHSPLLPAALDGSSAGSSAANQTAVPLTTLARAPQLYGSQQRAQQVPLPAPSAAAALFPLAPPYTAADEVGCMPLTHEMRVLQDCVVVLQGGEGRYVRWLEDHQAFRLLPTEELVATAQAARHVAAAGELGVMVRAIEAYVAGPATAAACIAGRALRSAVQQEMDGYYRAVAALDADVGVAAAALQQQFAAAADGGAQQGAAAPAAVVLSGPRCSLRRLAFWCGEWAARLRLLATMGDAAAGVRGAGAIASVVYTHCAAEAEDAANGGGGEGSAAGAAAARLIARASAPWLAMTYRWLTTGELPAAEEEWEGEEEGGGEGGGGGGGGGGFFVVAAPGVPEEQAWRRRYSLAAAQVPVFVPAPLAAALLEAGKSVQFVRRSCGDGGWAGEHLSACLLALAEAGVPLPAGTIAAARTSASAARAAAVQTTTAAPAAPEQAAAIVARARACAAEFATLTRLRGPDPTGTRPLQCAVGALLPPVHDRLLHLMLSAAAGGGCGSGSGGHRLLDHLRAIHRYVLLAQGDFVAALVAAVAPELDRPAGALAATGPAPLEALLEGAIRASNARLEDRDVLRRLGVRLLPAGPGDVGWDVFTLHYELRAPLSAVVTPACATAHARLFHFLFSVRRVEHTLSSTWSAVMNASHSLRALRHGGLSGVLHLCALLRTDMAGFVSTLLGYLTCEVLDASWARLAAALGGGDGSCGGVASFGALLEAHDAHLGWLTDRALLSPRTAAVQRPLGALLYECLRFCGLQAGMVQAALEQAVARRAAEAEIAARSGAGGWGVPVGVEDLDALDARAAAALAGVVRAFGPRIADVAATYRGRMAELLGALEAAAAYDGLEDLRDLVLRFDFNEYYTKRRDGASTAGS